jgi:sugar phosphate isomerase/epimerase
MLSTSTGGFAIGFRRGWSAWQQDLNGLSDWALESGLGVVDLGSDVVTSAPIVTAKGLKVGSGDLLHWSGLLSPDAGKRAEAVAANIAHIEAAAPLGVTNYFAVMLPEDPKRPRVENFGYMVESLNALTPVLEANNSHIVIEGWPGEGALCCTPEGYRAAFAECPSLAIGINFDPSHLIRMGIDALRFLQEFPERVFHVHGKDTEIFREMIYELGYEQPPTFAKGHGFGTATWRYTIPGHGEFPWKRGLKVLADAGYQGAVSIELEDEDYNTDETGEKIGLLAGANFLTTA